MRYPKWRLESEIRIGAGAWGRSLMRGAWMRKMAEKVALSLITRNVHLAVKIESGGIPAKSTKARTNNWSSTANPPHIFSNTSNLFSSCFSGLSLGSSTASSMSKGTVSPAAEMWGSGSSPLLGGSASLSSQFNPSTTRKDTK